MTVTSAGNTYFSATASLPAQPAWTRIEYVLHCFYNGETWLKANSIIIPPYGTGDPQEVIFQLRGDGGGYNMNYRAVETPYVLIDYPQENEVITSPTYTIRIGANSSTNSVRVKIDTGDWSQCRQSVGYWWFDWANYPAGAHEIIAEGWNRLGQRSETSIRHCSYQP
ncbi:MAG: hypothetical protein AB1349_06230 [Elusimicrobiota bacterium]